jgi:CspA family cold shock protein
LSIRRQGIIKWFSEAKGFGFIKPQEGPDLFVHLSACEDPRFRGLYEGQLVSYQLIMGTKGFQADHVRNR